MNIGIKWWGKKREQQIHQVKETLPTGERPYVFRGMYHGEPVDFEGKYEDWLILKADIEQKKSR